MITRTATEEVKTLAKQFKAVAIVGPQQSGKTTLARAVFKEKPYVSLENPDIRRFALEDPRSFLEQYPIGAIFDEAQRVPTAILPYLSVLESSFIIHLLKPHHQNFNKRLVKMPKLYFNDSGLACSLLGITKTTQL